MRKNAAITLTLKLACASLTIALLAACTQQPPRKQANGFGLWDGDATARSGMDEHITPGSPREFAVKAGDTVHFSTDSTELSHEAQETLQTQAKWLQQYPQYGIAVEGHADERGTREYNIALGAKRAAVVRQYLASQGIPATRIATTSYGKERPVAVCDDITCWTQNRRAVTVLDRKGGAQAAAY